MEFGRTVLRRAHADPRSPRRGEAGCDLLEVVLGVDGPEAWQDEIAYLRGP